MSDDVEPAAIHADELPEVWDVGLEGIAISLAQPHVGNEARYDAWYENDHFYAGGVMVPYVLSGRRWHATGAFREARSVTSSCPITKPRQGSRLVTYFLAPGGLAEFHRWAVRTLPKLRARGRMFPDRDIIFNALGRRTASFVGNDCVIDNPMFALDRTFRSLLVVAGSGADVAPAAPPPLPAKSIAVAFDLRVPQFGDQVLNPQLPAASETLQAAQQSISTVVLLFLTAPLVPGADAIEELAHFAAAHAGVEYCWAGGFVPMDGTDERLVDD